MDKKLQEQLFSKYPKIFAQKDMPMSETCMCWGIECGNGWYNLIDSLCGQLQWNTDQNKYPQVIATQVKEKYGTLRFYYTWEHNEKRRTAKERIEHFIYNILRRIMLKFCRNLYHSDREYGHQEGLISFADYTSGSTCESCGSNKDVTKTEGWIVTLCPECMKAYKEKH